jgi:hypothetical protein
MKKKPTVGSPFFGAFPSDRSPKTTKDVSVHFFIHSSNYCTFYQLIPERYGATPHIHRRFFPQQALNLLRRQYVAELR